MSKALRVTFLIHAVVSALIGGVLFIIPGRFLQWLEWAPIDPIMSRGMGAALLALAWTSVYGCRVVDRKNLAVLVQMEAIFTTLGCVGLLRHLLYGGWPIVPWLVFGILLTFAIAWVVFLIPRRT